MSNEFGICGQAEMLENGILSKEGDLRRKIQNVDAINFQKFKELESKLEKLSEIKKEFEGRKIQSEASVREKTQSINFFVYFFMEIISFP